MDGYGYVNDDDDDGDDDDEIAPDAKVSFFVVPPVKCLKSDNSGGLLRCPAPSFSCSDKRKYSGFEPESKRNLI